MQNFHNFQSRNFKILLSIVFLVTALIASTVSAESLHKSSYRYRSDLGRNSPLLDVYSSSANQNAPVMVFVHGGAWTIGSRSAVHHMPAHFNELGYIFVSLDYRLVPDVTVENQLEDIDHALAWVTKNIPQFGGNPRKLHLMGHSAGAHLVSMTGVDPGKHAKTLIAKGSLRSIISNDTRAYDIPRIATESRGGEMPRLYSKAFGSDPARWQGLSPIYQISGRKTPSFLLLYSGQGRNNGRSAFAAEFAASLRAIGTQVSVFDGSKYSHREINVGVGKKRDITSAISSFLASVAAG